MSSSFSASTNAQEQGLAEGVDAQENREAGGMPQIKSTADSADDCHLLELPAELRIRIYDMVLEDSPPKLSRNTRKKLTTGPGLLRVNEQIYAELTDRVLHGPMPIETTVNDYHFAHIVTFLNRLPDRELKKLTPAKDDTEEKRRLNIYLNFYDRWDLLKQFLQRWLNRLATDKRGSQIDICYFAGPDIPRPDRSYTNSRFDRAVAQSTIKSNKEGSVQQKEARRIMSALAPVARPLVPVVRVWSHNWR